MTPIGSASIIGRFAMLQRYEQIDRNIDLLMTVLINPAAFRRGYEARFDRTYPALAPKRSLRRTRRRRHLFVGSGRPGLRILNVRISAPTVTIVDPSEDFNMVELWSSARPTDRLTEAVLG